MIQRLTTIKTDAAAVFEKESGLLLVRIDASTITIVHANKQSGKWNALEVIGASAEDWQQPDFTQKLLQKSSLSGLKDFETKIFISTPDALLIPVKLLSDVSLFVTTQFGSKEGIQIKTASVDEEIAVAFTLSDTQMAMLTSLFPKAVYSSSLGLLVKQVLSMPVSDQQIFVLLHLSGQQAEIALAQEGKLILARSFVFAKNEDLLYHLLNICKQCSISPSAVMLKIQGQIKENAVVFELLQTYFVQICFAGTNKQKMHKKFWQIPTHYFTGLMESI